MAAPAKRLYTIPEAAEQLACGRQHIYDLIAAGQIAATDISLGKRPQTRISAKALDAYITARTRTAS